MKKVVIPFNNLLKAVTLVSIVPLFVLAMLVITQRIDLSSFFYAYFGILTASVLFVRPFLYEIASLTDYVEKLSQDKKVAAPNLSFLSTTSALSAAVRSLHRSWEKKKRQMENVIMEREILVDTLPDILIMIDDQLNIIRTNRAAREVFDQNLAQKKLTDIANNTYFINMVLEVVERMQARECEFSLDVKRHYDFRAIIEKFPVPSVGGISTIITMIDVTELKHAERMRADFVANASHEIRTPLAGIIGFIETLQGPAQEDADARQQFLSIMSEQAERMSHLVNDLLSLSKIEMKAQTLPTGKVDAQKVIDKECHHFEWAAKEKNLRIVTDIQPGLPSIRGDETEIAQVIHNLIGNAVKYCHANTAIAISARLTEKLPQDERFVHLEEAIRISVRDKGDGIPEEHIPRLTERFYRVDAARTRKVVGTGLGLAIVHHILNRHRGVMTVESTVGDGSVFSIYLPLFEDNPVSHR